MHFFRILRRFDLKEKIHRQDNECALRVIFNEARGDKRAIGKGHDYGFYKV